MLQIKTFCLNVILMTPQGNWTLAKVSINTLYRLFQYLAANSTTAIFFVNYKSHQTIKRFFIHFGRIRFPMDCLTQENKPNRLLIILHDK